jgi:hypothetical protein
MAAPERAVAQGSFPVVADSHRGRFDAAGGRPPADTLSGPTVLARLCRELVPVRKLM